MVAFLMIFVASQIMMAKESFGALECYKTWNPVTKLYEGEIHSCGSGQLAYEKCGGSFDSKGVAGEGGCFKVYDWPDYVKGCTVNEGKYFCFCDGQKCQPFEKCPEPLPCPNVQVTPSLSTSPKPPTTKKPTTPITSGAGRETANLPLIIGCVIGVAAVRRLIRFWP